MSGPFGLRVRILTTSRPREWQQGRLDWATLSVAMGDQLVTERQIVAISVDHARREDDGDVQDVPQSGTRDEPPIEHIVFLGVIAGAPRDRLEAWAWPERVYEVTAHARAARARVVTGTGVLALAR